MKITGTALAPGVSANQRKYTPECIGRACVRAKARIASGRPIVMKTHHGAEDSTKIVGRVTAVEQADDGSMQYEAELLDTEAARDIKALVKGPNPTLTGVSIVGKWIGQPRNELHRGQTVETADDLDLEGLDFTANPGVDAASVRAAESARRAGYIYESAPDALALPGGPDDNWTIRDLDALTPDHRTRAIEGYWTEVFAASDARKAPHSPFLAGL